MDANYLIEHAGELANFLLSKFAKTKSIDSIFEKASKNSIQWLKKIVSKKKRSVTGPPDKTKKEELVNLIVDEVKGSPENERNLLELLEVLSAIKFEQDPKINITSGKNIVTGSINSGGNVRIGDGTDKDI